MKNSFNNWSVFVASVVVEVFDSVVSVSVAVSMTAVGSSGVIVATGVVNVGEESSMRISMVLDGPYVATGLLNSVLAGDVLA